MMKGKQQVVAASAAFDTMNSKQAGKTTASVHLSLSAAMTPKKQEKLELLKEVVRKKQEELAQKCDDFRQKLESLSKQGKGTAVDGVNGVISARGTRSKQEREDPEMNNEVMPEKQEAANRQDCILPSAGGKVTLSADQAASGLLKDPAKQLAGLGQISTGNLSQPSPKGLRSFCPWPSAGFGGSSHWTPLQFKLDNGTTVFRVLPPLPDSLLDVTILKQHFRYFGEVVTVEIEDLDRNGEANHAGIRSVKVAFFTRIAAEKAFAQGRWYQGTSLNFSWVNNPLPSTSAGAASGNNAQLGDTSEVPRPSSSGTFEKGSDDAESDSKGQAAVLGGSQAEEGEPESERGPKEDGMDANEPLLGDG